MTLLDAPKFDEARARRRRTILISGVSAFFALFIGFWLFSGRPIDWPWNWYYHLAGRSAINSFLSAVEQNDMKKAYGIWLHDPNWEQHPGQVKFYTLDKFEDDWSPTSHDNEYGAIKSHHIAAARMYGNTLLVASYINDRKSDALNLDYDPKTHTITFAPPGVELYLGP
jgi:hypothetical protein